MKTILRKGPRHRSPFAAAKLALMVGATILASSLAQSANPETDATELLSRIHATNQAEIAVGKLAKEKGQTEKVRNFGEKLITDHTQADRQITALAKKEKITLRKPVADSEADKQEMQTHAEAAANLKTLSGPEFDKAFVAAMEQGHHDAIEMLENSKVSDAKIQSEIKKLLPVLKSHHEMAENIDKSETTAEKK